MTISEMVQVAYDNAYLKGFWEEWYQLNWVDHLEIDVERAKNNFIATRIALIHSEVSEALEALRIEDMENFAEELADIVIRVGDTAGGLGIDLQGEITKKMAANKKRPYKHGKAF